MPETVSGEANSTTSNQRTPQNVQLRHQHGNPVEAPGWGKNKTLPPIRSLTLPTRCPQPTTITHMTNTTTYTDNHSNTATLTTNLPHPPTLTLTNHTGTHTLHPQPTQPDQPKATKATKTSK